MPSGLIVALLVSISLIGGASWSRFFGNNEVQYDLMAVQPQIASDEYLDGMWKEALGATIASSSASVAKPLTGTDVVGRQLIMDYLSLAKNGQATEANLVALADRYVESIPTLNKATAILPTDIKVVGNDKASIKKYADEMARIQVKYSQLSGPNSEITDTISNEYYAFIKQIAKNYEGMASELMSLPAPAILASHHVKLINNSLSSASAAKSVSEMENDPATAFAGLIILRENADGMVSILTEAGKIINANVI